MPDLKDSLQWVRQGTELFSRALASLGDESETSDLAIRVTGHVRAWAGALGAAEGTTASGVRAAYEAEVASLLHQIGERPTRADWSDTVTIEGAEMPSAQGLWPLAQRLMLGAVDLDTGVGFDDLPREFLGALIDEITRQRATDGSPAMEILAQDTGEAWRLDGVGEPVRVMAPLVPMAGWLASRAAPGGKVKVLGPGELPDLPPWD